MLKFAIATLDVMGDFTPTRFCTPTFVDATLTAQDGSTRKANVAVPTELLARIQSAGNDLTSVVVETMRNDFQSCDTVVQVFLPGETVVPSRTGEPDENGDMAYLRRVGDLVEVGYAHHRFTLSAFRGMVTIDGGDGENQAYHPDQMLDQMIEGLMMLRDIRDEKMAKAA